MAELTISSSSLTKLAYKLAQEEYRAGVEAVLPRPGMAYPPLWMRLSSKERHKLVDTALLELLEVLGLPVAALSDPQKLGAEAGTHGAVAAVTRAIAEDWSSNSAEELATIVVEAASPYFRQQELPQSDLATEALTYGEKEQAALIRQARHEAKQQECDRWEARIETLAASFEKRGRHQSSYYYEDSSWEKIVIELRAMLKSAPDRITVTITTEQAKNLLAMRDSLEALVQNGADD